MMRGAARKALLGAISLAFLAGCTATTDEVASPTPGDTSPSPGASTPGPTLSERGRVVTKATELAGKWQADILFGRPVVNPTGPLSHPVRVVFGESSNRWWWNTDDGCNATGGRLSVSSDGVLTTGAGVSTLVGCPGIPGMKEHSANTKAVERADQARILAGDDGHPSELTLISGGEVVAVYTGIQPSTSG